jgi:hypothetical protein
VKWVCENSPQAPPVTSIVDLLEAQGLTWKAYAENITANDLQPTSTHPPREPRPPKGTFL